MPNIPGIIYTTPGVFGPTIGPPCFVFEKNGTKLSLGEDGVSLCGTYEDAAWALYEYMEDSKKRFDNYPSYYPTGMTAAKFDMDWKEDFKLTYIGEEKPEEFIKIKVAFDKICKMKVFV